MDGFSGNRTRASGLKVPEYIRIIFWVSTVLTGNNEGHSSEWYYFPRYFWHKKGAFPPQNSISEDDSPGAVCLAVRLMVWCGRNGVSHVRHLAWATGSINSISIRKDGSGDGAVTPQKTGFAPENSSFRCEMDGTMNHFIFSHCQATFWWSGFFLNRWGVFLNGRAKFLLKSSNVWF